MRTPTSPDADGPDYQPSPQERSTLETYLQRISDIAAQIAHMTMTLEKSGSPIAAILADSANGIGGTEVTAPRPGNLTDRIRALQPGASRISTAS